MTDAPYAGEPILGFVGEHAILSNFHAAHVTLEGRLCPDVETAYQAAKCEDPAWRARVLAAGTPGKAKRIARTAPIRTDWPEVRVEIMRSLLRQKFAWPHLSSALLATGDRELIELNHWGDRFWGVVRGEQGLEGANTLGRLLMQVREELRSSAAAGAVLIAFDLEATCWDDPSSIGQPEPMPEIIEIGAVAWTAPLEPSREEYQSFVRPTEQPTLSDFCRALTSIRQREVDMAWPLADELPRFLQWCASFGAYRLVSWGSSDAEQMRAECTRKIIPLELIEARHVNAKAEFAQQMNLRRQEGLGRAAKRLAITPSEPRHRAIADARTLADILDRGLGAIMSGPPGAGG